MKNTYVKPEMQVEEFLANQYCSNCGKKDGKYIFTCDAPAGVIHYYDASGKDINRGKSYSPCGETHVTDGPDSYYEGYVDRNGNGREDPGEAALIWLQPVSKYGIRTTNGHASASLTRQQIEVENS